MNTLKNKFSLYGEIFLGGSPKISSEGIYYQAPSGDNLYLYCNNRIHLVQKFYNLFIEVPKRKFLLGNLDTRDLINTAFDKFLAFKPSWLNPDTSYRVSYEEFSNLSVCKTDLVQPLKDVLFPSIENKNDYVWRITCLSKYTFNDLLLMISNQLRDPLYLEEFSNVISPMIYGKSIMSRYASTLLLK